MSRDLKNAAYAELARVGKALANPLRLELLDLLCQAPLDVESLAHAAERPIASVSQHLQVLAAAHLVTRERRGIRIIYSLADGVDDLFAAVERTGLSRLAELPAHRAASLAQHPGVSTVPANELRTLLDNKQAILVDVRPQNEFGYGHIDEARSVPLDSLAAQLPTLPVDQEIIVCCRGPWCTWADEAVEQLHHAGFRSRRFEGRALQTRAESA